jgi:hypothetical protein
MSGRRSRNKSARIEREIVRALSADFRGSTPCKTNCPCTSADGVERGQGAGAVAGQRRCRTAAAECTAGCPRAPRRVTRMPSSTDTIRLKQSRVGVRLRSCCAIAGVGLDRRTGLFHRIDPLLQACIPANPPTEQDVQDALVFLCDEWLVDVALDPVGKAVGIMLAKRPTATE